MDFQQYLQSTVEIDQEIERILDDWQKQTNTLSTKLTPFSQAFIDACQGGKRVRGNLVKLGYRLTGGKDDQKVLPVAAAIEIFQTAILAHDDIIDQGDLRRGKPTLYRSLGGDHHAVSQTICLGDIGFFIAAKAVAESDFPEEVKNEALQIFCEMVISTGLGEMLDVQLPYLPQDKTEEDVMTVHRLKTAYYTIVYPLWMGATLAGAGPQVLNPMKEFGEKLGIAFQIQDDILGIFGDEEILGKSVTSDIEEGKNTTLIVHAQKMANDKQRKILDQYYGQGKIGSRELEMIKQVFVETGALQHSQDKANQLAEEAKQLIPEVTTDPDYQLLLSQMADYLVKRKK